MRQHGGYPRVASNVTMSNFLFINKITGNPVETFFDYRSFPIIGLLNVHASRLLCQVVSDHVTNTNGFSEVYE